MEMVTEEYRAFVIAYPRVPVDAARWIVNLSSNDARLNVQLRGGNEVFTDHGVLKVQCKKRRIGSMGY
jgi:hypothetical protein